MRNKDARSASVLEQALEGGAAGAEHVVDDHRRAVVHCAVLVQGPPFPLWEPLSIFFLTIFGET
ncbi:MAG: hypothetical protein ACWGNK_05680, partial [Desulfobacterales bacterium]